MFTENVLLKCQVKRQAEGFVSKYYKGLMTVSYCLQITLKNIGLCSSDNFHYMSSHYKLILLFFFFFFSVMMKLANTPRAVSTSSWLVILRKEQFVQTILAVMGVLLERYTSQTCWTMFFSFSFPSHILLWPGQC